MVRKQWSNEQALLGVVWRCLALLGVVGRCWALLGVVGRCWALLHSRHKNLNLN